MIVALDQNDNRILAENALKGQDYYCPICHNRVMFRSGKIRKRHFSHKKHTCTDKWNYDMSDWHREWQELFPPECREVVIDKGILGGVHRADILTENDIVIEFQHSPMTPDEFAERNQFYTSASNKRLVWLFDLQTECDGNRVAWDINPYSAVFELGINWKWARKTFLSFNAHQPNCSVFIQVSDQVSDRVGETGKTILRVSRVYEDGFLVIDPDRKYTPKGFLKAISDADLFDKSFELVDSISELWRFHKAKFMRVYNIRTNYTFDIYKSPVEQAEKYRGKVYGELTFPDGNDGGNRQIYDAYKKEWKVLSLIQ